MPTLAANSDSQPRSRNGINARHITGVLSAVTLVLFIIGVVVVKQLAGDAQPTILELQSIQSTEQATTHREAKPGPDDAPIVLQPETTVDLSPITLPSWSQEIGVSETPQPIRVARPPLGPRYE